MPFLVGLAVVLLVYVGGGVAWAMKDGKKGKQTLPHARTWLNLLSLVKDGLLYSRRVVGGGGGGYDKIAVGVAAADMAAGSLVRQFAAGDTVEVSTEGA